MSVAAPNQPTPPSMLDRLRARFSQSQADLDRISRQTEQQKRELVHTENELKSLTRQVDVARAQFVAAESLFEHRKDQLRQLEVLLLDAWGNNEVAGGPNYRLIVELRASLDDYPRCRKHLVEKLEAAKAALEKFEKRNLK